MKNVQHPQLPDCEPYPLKFKEVPVTNGDGQSLRRCNACNGGGSVCKGEKVDPKTAPTPPMSYTFTARGPTGRATNVKVTPSRASAARRAAVLVW